MLMVLTVIGFSFGLYFAKSVSFFDVLSYLSPMRFLQPRKKQEASQSHYHATFSAATDSNSSFDSRRPEEVLGLSSDFTQEELKAAYQRESNRTHPDKWANKSKALQQMMSAEQQQINAAYKKLKR
jgi:DnaJ-domain-containing protein 1